ncbi:MAG: SusD/RagB family nutrient-binding outer membrane lipoprotein, partial [Pedobacter sp.]
MKNYKIYLLSILTLAVSSCSKELDKVNINPNATENAQPDYLLTGAIKNTTDAYW